eukprot:Sspe_Gene.59399::Locus_32620_Transcript_1_1_Confidence_1.000_Length_1509::g.59399::m.59399/K10666/RNF5; E3 ubiquitin-protein ligase RNF5
MASSSEGTERNEASNFDCGVCLEKAADPVVTLCGHLFCWPCLDEWLGRAKGECPICKATCDRSTVIPMYGKGRENKRETSAPRPQAQPPPPSESSRPRRHTSPFQMHGFGGIGFGFPFVGMTFTWPPSGEYNEVQ